MKVFHKLGKVNYVDDMGRFVGWDDEQNCCEQHYHWLSPPLSDERLEKYSFDPDFFEEWNRDSQWDEPPKFAVIGDPFEEGSAVRFRLVSNDGRVAYLILENYHNGYYAHNFSYDFGSGEVGGYL